MASEASFIAALRRIATDPAARGLMDDAAVLAFGGTSLVLTHDMIVEGVHFLSSDPPEDVAWKLVAVNLSDLAAKGARPLGVLLGYPLSQDEDWDQAFVRGLEAALAGFETSLLGGDSVSNPAGAARSLGLTAVGQAGAAVPSRAGAQEGDGLWVSGTIGDAGAGLRVAIGEIEGSDELVQRYRRPVPRLEAGRTLASIATAMMDVSDGLLIDAARMADASGLGLRIDLATVPLSSACIAATGDDLRARIDAAIAGDDYELLFAAPEAEAARIGALAQELHMPLTRIGSFDIGAGLRLTHSGVEVPRPPSLGYEHGSSRTK